MEIPTNKKTLKYTYCPDIRRKLKLPRLRFINSSRKMVHFPLHFLKISFDSTKEYIYISKTKNSKKKILICLVMLIGMNLNRKKHIVFFLSETRKFSRNI